MGAQRDTIEASMAAAIEAKLAAAELPEGDNLPALASDIDEHLPDRNAEEQLARDIALAQEKAEVEVGEAVDELESRARAAATDQVQITENELAAELRRIREQHARGQDELAAQREADRARRKAALEARLKKRRQKAAKARKERGATEEETAADEAAEAEKEAQSRRALMAQLAADDATAYSELSAATASKATAAAAKMVDISERAAVVATARMEEAAKKLNEVQSHQAALTRDEEERLRLMRDELERSLAAKAATQIAEIEAN